MDFFAEEARPTPKAHGKLSEVLKERGYVYQHSADLVEIADGQMRTVYEGFDPSADSLHVGNLMGMLVLRRFLEAGHKVLLVVGGGTGMIGDPSGKSEERTLLTAEQVAHNSARIAKQAEKLFNSKNFTLVNNADWLGKLNILDFLRDVGKGFSVNEMMRRDSVKERLEGREQGISYTEFSYMLLQAYDFLYLHQQYGCDWQHGSSDQWGNIVSGIDLIRRHTGKTVYGTTHGLLINKSTGRKFGKSEGGAVWLDPEKTSPFEFYQFWFNTSDEDVEEYLLKMTLLPKEDIDAVMEEQRANPAGRAAQKKLAYEVTKLVHGEDEAKKAQNLENKPVIPAGKLRDIVPNLSTSELRRLVAQGGISSLNIGKIDTIDIELKSGDTLKIGKSRMFTVE